ncbi:hypothetical protein R1flu_005653 [Riccia fluitans]|uniref:Uncharacterized protein n=1 Tax=Riccia fluitans TaxID=41844 RepID=A0ABD1YTR8_9MARC
MDTTEGGALVKDNRSSGVGERQGSQPRMRGVTQTLLPVPKSSTAFGTLEFHRTRSFRAKKRLVDQAYKKEGSNKHIRGCSSVLEKLKLQIRELDARQRGKAILLATQEEASRAS